METTAFNFTDLIGYTASIIILVSFIMKDIKTLRIVGSIGATFFVAYGVLLNFAIPLIITNVAIVVINIYYLLKAKKI